MLGSTEYVCNPTLQRRHNYLKLFVFKVNRIIKIEQQKRNKHCLIQTQRLISDDKCNQSKVNTNIRLLILKFHNDWQTKNTNTLKFSKNGNANDFSVMQWNIIL